MQSVSELQSSDQLKVRLNTAFLLLRVRALSIFFFVHSVRFPLSLSLFIIQSLVVKVVLFLVFIAIETLEVGDVSGYLMAVTLGDDCGTVDFEHLLP